MVQPKVQRVSKTNLCPVCKGDHKCGVTSDGLILCGRATSAPFGFVHLGPSKDPTWHLFRLESEASPPRQAASSGPNRLAEIRLQHQHFVKQSTPETRQALARKLGLPPAALEACAELGWDSSQRCWTWPERDGEGEIVGLTTRFGDGSKRAVAGSQRGLFAPGNWVDRPGPLFIVEGFSDAIALNYLGLAVLARPSASSGAAMIIRLLLREAKTNRLIIILGENDQKDDGTWPGRTGAEFLREKLAAGLPGFRICTAYPPDDYKDAREWVVNRLADGANEAPDAPLELGKDIADQIGRAAEQSLQAKRLAPPTAFPVPMPITALAEDQSRFCWLWEGFLARDRITLLSALPKCGKTTLLSHLLRSLHAGGSFCGRAVMPGRAVVVSEESAGEWVARREQLGLTDAICVSSRPFFGKPTLEAWQSYLLHLVDYAKGTPVDLFVFDTLADLWPAKDENSAVEVQSALQPLRSLAATGAAVVLVHHLRKSDGGEGTGSRGSGALAGFVDIMVELRRAPRAIDPKGNRRVLKAYGRMKDIPPEWMIEYVPEREEYIHLAEATQAINGLAAAEPDECESRNEAIRVCDVREAIISTIAAGGAKEWTREELWLELPEKLRKNQKRFFSILEAEAGNLWAKKGSGTNREPFRYTRKPRLD